MFEFLFKYPSAVFSHGTFVLLSGWPMWVLGAGLVAAAAFLAWMVWRPGEARGRAARAASTPQNHDWHACGSSPGGAVETH